MTPQSVNSCKFTGIARYDAKGYIPVWAINRKIKHSLSTAQELRDSFDRDDQIDNEDRTRLINIMKRGREKYLKPELDIINTTKEKFIKLETGDLLVPIESPDHHVKMSSGFIPGEDYIVCRAETEVDASIEACSAFDYQFSRARVKSFYNLYGGLEYDISKFNDHCNITRRVYDLTGISTIHPREWLAKTVWKLDDGKFVVASVPIIDENLAPSNSRFVRATMYALLIFERLEVDGEIPRTKVIYYAQANLGGHIPKAFVNSQTSGLLMHMGTTRNRFHRSLEIDKIRRDATVASFHRHDVGYPKVENDQIEASLASLQMFDMLPNKKKVDSVSSAKLATGRNEGERSAFWRSSAIIRASPQQILAYHWNFMARHLEDANMIDKHVIQEVNDHNKLVHMIQVITNPVADRELVSRFLWKKLDNTGKNIVFVVAPATHENYNENSVDMIPARFSTTVKLAELREGETEMNCLIHLDVGGIDTSGLVTYFMNLHLGKRLKRILYLQNYFQKLRPLNLLDEQDGVAMGEAFTLQYTNDEKEKSKSSKRSKAAIRVQAVISSHVALKQYQDENPWLGELMIGVCSNNLRMAGTVSTRLLTLTEKEGRTIGNSLSSILMSSTSAELAVDDCGFSLPKP